MNLKEVLKYLKECSYETTLNLETDKAIFVISNYDIVFAFYSLENNLFDEDNYLNITGEIIDILCQNTISSVSIVSTEQLNYRESIPELNLPESKSLLLFQFAKSILNFEETAIQNYRLVDDYSYHIDHGMCPYFPNYGFEIVIKPSLWDNVAFFKSLINKEIKYDIRIPTFYYSGYKEWKNKYSPANLIVKSTNTKVRRLGYLKLLIQQHRDKIKIPQSKYNKIFENYAEQYQSDLEKYKYPKGLIKKTKTGSSSKPYVDFALNFNLIVERNNVFSLSKISLVYSKLIQIIENKNEDSLIDKNPFYLNNLDRLFFLEHILKEDYFYLSALLEFLYLNSNVSYSHLVDKYYMFILNKLEEYSSYSSIKFYNSKTKSSLTEIRDRIRKWDNPIIYLEHILMPRINWLLDLELVKISHDGNSTNYSLTTSGITLFKNMCFWNDIAGEKVMDSEYFLERYYIKSFCDIYNLTISQTQRNNKGIKELIIKTLKLCFEYFKTLAPNRVTYSQALLFTRNYLFLKFKLIIDYNELAKYITQELSSLFIVKLQSHYGDGYIQIKNISNEHH